MQYLQILTNTLCRISPLSPICLLKNVERHCGVKRLELHHLLWYIRKESIITACTHGWDMKCRLIGLHTGGCIYISFLQRVWHSLIRTKKKKKHVLKLIDWGSYACTHIIKKFMKKKKKWALYEESFISLHRAVWCDFFTMYFFLFPSIGGALQNCTLWSVLNQTALFLHAGSFLQRLAKSAEAGGAFLVELLSYGIQEENMASAECSTSSGLPLPFWWLRSDSLCKKWDAIISYK